MPIIVMLLAAILIAGCNTSSSHHGDASKSSGGQHAMKVFDFSGIEVGKLPPQFTAALTGEGGPASWAILEDLNSSGDKRVLAQTSNDRTNGRFPLCVYDGLSARDIEISIHFKSVSGVVDEAAGVIVRYQNKDNYYVARANALENNVRFYKVEAGRRSKIAGIDVRVSAGEWHTLKLNVKGTHFIVKYDNESLEADDSTFQNAGMAGLWTKADSVTYFDNLKIESFDQNSK
jgi:hypothetical protein